MFSFCVFTVDDGSEATKNRSMMCLKSCSWFSFSCCYGPSTFIQGIDWSAKNKKAACQDWHTNMFQVQSRAKSTMSTMLTWAFMTNDCAWTFLETNLGINLIVGPFLLFLAARLILLSASFHNYHLKIMLSVWERHKWIHIIIILYQFHALESTDCSILFPIPSIFADYHLKSMWGCVFVCVFV